jgi:hypothetical protein
MGRLYLVEVELSLCMPWRHMRGVDVFLVSFLSLILDAGEWSASCTGHFTSIERALAPTQWGWVGPRTSLDILGRGRKLLPSWESNDKFLSHLYRWHPVLIYEEQNGSTDCKSQLNFYHFYCWLHLLTLVKSYHQAIKNEEREIIGIKLIRMTLFR